MPIAINGSGTITGISTGGLPDGCISTDDLANNAVTAGKMGATEQSRLCAAFVNFNGTGTVAIRASYNVSSITDNGVGDYTVNFTTALADANYSAQCTIQYDQASNVTTAAVFGSYARFPPTSSACRVSSQNYTTVFDCIIVSVAIFR
jgi:hypothetical protein